MVRSWRLRKPANRKSSAPVTPAQLSLPGRARVSATRSASDPIFNETGTATVITVAVPVSLNIGSLADLVALTRARPGKLNWAGVTGALDFLFAGFLKRQDLTMTKVPYRNPVEAANDLAEGRVQMYMAALAIVRPQLQTGKIQLLAVTNSVRAPAATAVPTVKEA